MDFRLAQPLRGIGGQYTVPPPCVILSCCCQLLGDVLNDKGSCAMWDGDLFSVATSPDLMTATVAVLHPSVHTGEAFQLLVVHSSAIISFISSASIAASSHATPSAVLQSIRPICPSHMQRWNLSHGVSSSLQNFTHAFAVLYRNSSLPIHSDTFHVS